MQCQLESTCLIVPLIGGNPGGGRVLRGPSRVQGPRIRTLPRLPGVYRFASGFVRVPSGVVSTWAHTIPRQPSLIIVGDSGPRDPPTHEGGPCRAPQGLPTNTNGTVGKVSSEVEKGPRSKQQVERGENPSNREVESCKPEAQRQNFRGEGSEETNTREGKRAEGCYSSKTENM